MPYFDYNATSPLRPEAAEALTRLQAESWRNPSSPYRRAGQVRAQLEEARERLAELLGAAPGRVVFTSGATEANNAVIRHHFDAVGGRGRLIAFSAVEHPSVREAAQRIWGPEYCREIPTNPATGAVDPAVVDSWVRKAERRHRPALVAVMAANNETGILQPWREVAALCSEVGTPFHCDATQWVGKEPLNELGQCAWLAACAHKFGGPKGVGFLLVPEGSGLHAQHGGSQEKDHRGGTENFPAIGAMLAALEAAERDRRSGVGTRQADYRDAFEAALESRIPYVRIVGRTVPRLWNTSIVIPPRHANTKWVARLDKAGIEASTGSACATGKGGPSYVLAAHRITSSEARRAIRISGGCDSTEADWVGLADHFGAILAELDAEGEDPAFSGPAEVIEV